MANNKLANLMRERGVTVKALGDLSGISWRTIENLYQGRRKTYNAQAYIVLELAEALGVHPAEIVDDPPLELAPGIKII